MRYDILPDAQRRVTCCAMHMHMPSKGCKVGYTLCRYRNRDLPRPQEPHVSANGTRQVNSFTGNSIALHSPNEQSRVRLYASTSTLTSPLLNRLSSSLSHHSLQPPSLSSPYLGDTTAALSNPSLAIVRPTYRLLGLALLTAALDARFEHLGLAFGSHQTAEHPRFRTHKTRTTKDPLSHPRS